MLRPARHIGIAARVLALITLAACTDPAGPGPEPGFFGLASFSFNPFLLAGVPTLPADSCPPYVASRLPTTRRTIPGSGATIALPPTALTVPIERGGGVVYRIPGEGLIGVAYDSNSVNRLSFSNGRFRDPQYSFLSLTACDIVVDGRAARLFVNVLSGFNFSDSTATTPLNFLPLMFLMTTTPTGRPVNITLEGATVTSVAVQPPPDPAADRNFAILRLLSHIASIQW